MVSNTQMHRDLELLVFNDYALVLPKKTLERTSWSENPLIEDLGELDPHSPPFRVAKRRILEDA